jgi:hypothetical protein
LFNDGCKNFISMNDNDNLALGAKATIINLPQNRECICGIFEP